MVREDILEGLKNAVSKGQSLQQAMMSFYNAGYPREEIQEAARYLQMSMYSQQHPQTSQQPAQETFQQQPMPTQKPQKPVSQQVQQQPQQISNQQPTAQLPQTQKVQQLQQISTQMLQPQQLTQPNMYQTEKKSGKTFYIVMITLLIFLVGALISIIIFKEQLVQFFIDLFA